MIALILSSNDPVSALLFVCVCVLPFFRPIAAFVPLTELSDPGIIKKYGVKPDAETLDILNTIARQKEVVSTFHLSSFNWPNKNSNCKNTQTLVVHQFSGRCSVEDLLGRRP